jgi:hypothetical protein
MSAPHAWVAVASADHVRRGRREGFMQVCHGKAAPLRRVQPGDRVVYYSPATHPGGRDGLQAFTALGTVLPGEPYEVDMGEGFRPFRRDVAWDADRSEASILPLLGQLSFTSGRRNWGYAFRFGLLPISVQDVDLIAAAMQRRAVAEGAADALA